MTAGVGEDGGLHAAPIVPETAAEAPPDASDVAAPDADAPDAVPTTLDAADAWTVEARRVLAEFRDPGPADGPSRRHRRVAERTGGGPPGRFGAPGAGPR